jgi:hypothetical protein
VRNVRRMDWYWVVLDFGSMRWSVPKLVPLQRLTIGEMLAELDVEAVLRDLVDAEEARLVASRTVRSPRTPTPVSPLATTS